MRKKIIIGIATSLFAVAGLFGVNNMNQNANSDISLSSIAVMAEAQAEYRICCIGSRFLIESSPGGWTCTNNAGNSCCPIC